MFDGVNWLWFVRLGLRRSDARALLSYRKDWCWPFLQEALVPLLASAWRGSSLAPFPPSSPQQGPNPFRFSWSLDSFAAGWIWGTLLAVSLLWSASLFNSQINIVRALKGGRLTIKSGVPWGLYLIQIMALGGAVISLAGLFFLGIGKWACLCCLCFARRLPHPDGDASSDLAIACIPRFKTTVETLEAARAS